MGIITVDTRARKPIWEQLVDNVKELIFRGLMEPDEQLPAVRTLSHELTINPNTIAKAYAELERQGIIYTVHGRGSFVCADVKNISEKKREKVKAELLAAIDAAYAAGIEKAQILELIENHGGDKIDRNK